MFLEKLLYLDESALEEGASAKDAGMGKGKR